MFKGFPRECIQFFIDLKQNNNKEWFDSHKDFYKKFVVEPYQEFVNSIAGKMLEIDPLFEMEPKVGKTISRIYRDVRFSKDKTPYRTNAWIAVKRSSKEWKEAPSYYFDLSEDTLTHGIGYYMATKDTMDRMRAIIEDEPDRILEFIELINSKTEYKVMGENYKKILNKNIEEPLIDWYQKKNIYLMYSAPITDIIYTPEIADRVVEDFVNVGEIYRFFTELIA